MPGGNLPKVSHGLFPITVELAGTSLRWSEEMSVAISYVAMPYYPLGLGQGCWPLDTLSWLAVFWLAFPTFRPGSHGVLSICW